jgi:hypothetical protein
MNDVSYRHARWPKMAVGGILLCRALLAMHFYTSGIQAPWPIDARPSSGLLRSMKQTFAPNGADDADSGNGAERTRGSRGSTTGDLP